MVRPSFTYTLLIFLVLMPLIHVFASVLIAVTMQALPTFANLGPTTLASEIIPALQLPEIATNAYVTSLYAVATIASFGAAAFVLKNGPIRAGQWALGFYFVGGFIIAAFPHPLSFCTAALLYGVAYTMPIPLGAHILVHHTPPHMRNTLFGIRQMGVPIGGLAAGLCFPLMSEAGNWRLAIFIAALTCLCFALLMQPIRRRFDTERNPNTRLFSIKGHNPISVIRSAPQMRRLCFAGMLFAGAEVTAVTNIVFFLSHDVGWSLTSAGMALSVLSVGGALGRLFWGILADRISNNTVMLGCLGIAIFVTMAALAIWSHDAQFLVFVAAFSVGVTAGGWTGVGIAEGARLAGRAGPVAGTAALTQFMFLGVVLLPLMSGVALALGATYPYVFASVGALSGLGGLTLLLAPPR